MDIAESIQHILVHGAPQFYTCGEINTELQKMGHDAYDLKVIKRVLYGNPMFIRTPNNPPRWSVYGSIFKGPPLQGPAFEFRWPIWMTNAEDERTKLFRWMGDCAREYGIPLDQIKCTSADPTLGDAWQEYVQTVPANAPQNE